jgi:hypothetical protein
MSEEFENILMRRRSVPPPSADFAERIIAEAVKRPRFTIQRPVSLWDSFCDMFVLPRPAFALAVFLVCGAGVGFNNYAQSMFVDARDEMVSAYSLVADSYDGGSFL